MLLPPSDSRGPGHRARHRARGLSKRFGHQLAVDGVDLAVPKGSVFGFLGPNGSGKTTTIRMLLGLAGATAGSVNVLGLGMRDRFHEVLPRVGALVEGPAFYPFLSGAAVFGASTPQTPMPPPPPGIPGWRRRWNAWA